MLRNSGVLEGKPSVVELHLETALIAILEHGEILEGPVDIMDIVQRGKEASHQHEGNDQDGGQREGNIGVLEQRREQQAIRTRHPGHSFTDQNGQEEHTRILLEGHCPVGNGVEQNWEEQVQRQGGQRTSPEEGRGGVGDIGPLFEEDRPLKVEDVEGGEDVAHPKNEDHGEDNPLGVLDEGYLVISLFLEQDDHQHREEDSGEESGDEVGRLPELHQESSGEDFAELERP